MHRRELLVYSSVVVSSFLNADVAYAVDEWDWRAIRASKPSVSKGFCRRTSVIVYLTHHAATSSRCFSSPHRWRDIDGISSCNLEELCSNDPSRPPSSEHRLLKRKCE